MSVFETVILNFIVVAVFLSLFYTAVVKYINRPRKEKERYPSASLKTSKKVIA